VTRGFERYWHLAPKLLAKLRLLTLSPAEFDQGPSLASWLTDKEKHAILQFYETCDSTMLPGTLSQNKEKRYLVPTEKYGVLHMQRNLIHQMNNSTFDTGSNPVCVFKFDKSCRLIGIEVPTRSKGTNNSTNVPSGAHYDESFYINCEKVGNWGSPIHPGAYQLGYVQNENATKQLISYTARCLYDDLSPLKIIFRDPLNVLKNEWYVITANQFYTKGIFPLFIRQKTVTFQGVTLTLSKINVGMSTPVNDGFFQSFIVDSVVR
jgi:hypothetical protein